MHEPIKLETRRNEQTTETLLMATIDDILLHKMTAEALLREIVARVAQRYVDEMYPVIARSLDAQAIANLAIAEAGAEISRSLKEKLPVPDKVLIVETPGSKEVYQRGILGGLKRIR